jgi:hypothetical protein
VVGHALRRIRAAVAARRQPRRQRERRDAVPRQPHEQAVAIALRCAASKATRPTCLALVPTLAHAHPLVRFYAQRALEKITGHPIAIDLDAWAVQIGAQLAREPITAC